MQYEFKTKEKIVYCQNLMKKSTFFKQKQNNEILGRKCFDVYNTIVTIFIWFYPFEIEMMRKWSISYPNLTKGT